MTGDAAGRGLGVLVRAAVVGVALLVGTVLAGPGAWSSTEQEAADRT